MATRTKLGACLVLARVSNLPTVWTNVIAAHVVADAPFATLLTGLVAMSLFYTGGMFLNDAFDAPFDAATRADRPIPAESIAATVMHALGLPLDAQLPGPEGKLIRVVEDGVEPVRELF